jgi:hypothetical protein
MVDRGPALVDGFLDQAGAGQRADDIDPLDVALKIIVRPGNA